MLLFGHTGLIIISNDPVLILLFRIFSRRLHLEGKFHFSLLKYFRKPLKKSLKVFTFLNLLLGHQQWLLKTVVEKFSNLYLDWLRWFSFFLTNCVDTYEPLSLLFETVDKVVKELIFFHELWFLENLDVHVLWLSLLEQFHELRFSVFDYFFIHLEKIDFGSF